MEDGSDPKSVAWRWVEAVVAGDGVAVRSVFAPGCRIFIAGDMPFCGWMDVDAFFAQTTVLPLDGPITFEIGEMVVEGDRVWFEAQSNARLIDGADYRNFYIFQLLVSEGRIVEYKELTDTLHVWRTIDAPETRGPAIVRQPFLTRVVRRLVGKSVGETERGEAAA